MSDALTLPAELRERAGKGASRELRRSGRVPAVIYGGKEEPLAIHVEAKELVRQLGTGHFMNSIVMVEVGGKAVRVLPKDVALHPVTDRPLHADFLRLSKDDKIHVEVPVVFINEEASPGLKKGGVLNIVRHELELICESDKIPDDIQLDLTGVDLGNPGPQYAMHRHNVGFMALDVIAEMHSVGPVQKKFQGWLQEGRIAGIRVLLLKPATFMNESGRSVGEALRFYKLGVDALTVFHDELDLAPFKVKVKSGGGTAGHNGLRSIDQHIGPEFRRVRLGIGHPEHKDRVTGYVLGNYSKTEMDPLADMLGAIGGETEWLARGEDARFMSDVALRQQG